MNFKPGDIIIGTKEANIYGITREGWVGKVLETRGNEIVVYGPGHDKRHEESFPVESKCFELYCEEIKEQDVLSLL